MLGVGKAFLRQAAPSVRRGRARAPRVLGPGALPSRGFVPNADCRVRAPAQVGRSRGWREAVTALLSPGPSHPGRRWCRRPDGGPGGPGLRVPHRAPAPGPQPAVDPSESRPLPPQRECSRVPEGQPRVGCFASMISVLELSLRQLPWEVRVSRMVNHGWRAERGVAQAVLLVKSRAGWIRFRPESGCGQDSCRPHRPDLGFCRAVLSGPGLGWGHGPRCC